MDQATLLRWNAQEFLGFWFFNNFLRAEGVSEATRLEIVAMLTEQCESFRLAQVNKNPFSPLIRIQVRTKRHDEIRILVEKPGQPGTLKSVVGEVDLALDQGIVKVRQMCLI